MENQFFNSSHLLFNGSTTSPSRNIIRNRASARKTLWRILQMVTASGLLQPGGLKDGGASQHTRPRCDETWEIWIIPLGGQLHVAWHVSAAQIRGFRSSWGKQTKQTKQVIKIHESSLVEKSLFGSLSHLELRKYLIDQLLSEMMLQVQLWNWYLSVDDPKSAHFIASSSVLKMGYTGSIAPKWSLFEGQWRSQPPKFFRDTFLYHGRGRGNAFPAISIDGWISPCPEASIAKSPCYSSRVPSTRRAVSPWATDRWICTTTWWQLGVNAEPQGGGKCM